MELSPAHEMEMQPQEPVIEKRNNRILIGPCISAVVIGLFIIFSVIDFAPGDVYAGMSAALISIWMELFVIVVSIFCICAFFRAAKHKGIGLFLNISMILIGAWVQMVVIFSI